MNQNKSYLKSALDAYERVVASMGTLDFSGIGEHSRHVLTNADETRREATQPKNNR